jgi:hypothetical protein
MTVTIVTFLRYVNYGYVLCHTLPVVPLTAQPGKQATSEQIGVMIRGLLSGGWLDSIWRDNIYRAAGWMPGKVTRL